VGERCRRFGTEVERTVVVAPRVWIDETELLLE
jgi:hypothetical protein